MAKQAVVLIDPNDDDRRETSGILYSCTNEDRARIARYFIGFHCEIEVELVRGTGSQKVEVAIEGVAQAQGGYWTWGLVTSTRPWTHDLSRMEFCPLSTIRSIKTLRRF